jgi:hypothetical protein
MVCWRPSTLTTSELSVERADGPDQTATSSCDGGTLDRSHR